VLVDNTGPVFESGPVAEAKGGRVTLGARVTDAQSPIKSVEYAVGSKQQWRAVLPVDLIHDSTSEDVRVSIDGLAPGTHVLTLRVTDGQNNRAYASVPVTVPRK
jgi:hypothetical protein